MPKEYLWKHNISRIYWKCVNFRGGGNKHMHAYMHCRCEQILDCTNNPVNVFTLIFTLSPDLYEILDSVRSDPYIQFYFFGPNKNMRVKMPNFPRNITISNGEGFFQHPLSLFLIQFHFSNNFLKLLILT